MQEFRKAGGNEKAFVKKLGGEYIKGYQLRYIYFIDKSKQKDLTVPILPFSKIDELNAGMYKGKKITYKERNAPVSQ